MCYVSENVHYIAQIKNYHQKSATQTNSVATMDIVPQVAILAMETMTVTIDLMSAIVPK